MDPVDVIISVFDGYEEVRACLESVLACEQQTPADYVVINDASPNPRIHSYLRELADVGSIILLENTVNCGFVKTVNRGMAREPDRDVVLLNADTVVGGDWLDRLRAAALRSRDVGTVTPFSNNAEICGFPRLCRDNPLPMAAADIDGVLGKHLSGQDVTIPTAVGFCMYIRRDCLALRRGKRFLPARAGCRLASCAGGRLLRPACRRRQLFCRKTHAGAARYGGAGPTLSRLSRRDCRLYPGRPALRSALQGADRVPQGGSAAQGAGGYPSPRWWHRKARTGTGRFGGRQGAGDHAQAVSRCRTAFDPGRRRRLPGAKFRLVHGCRSRCPLRSVAAYRDRPGTPPSPARHG